MLQIGFLAEKAIHNIKKSPMGTFHEVLPGNLNFFHFYYIDTIEINLLDQTTELNRKKHINMENFMSGIQNLCKLFRDQTVPMLVVSKIFLTMSVRPREWMNLWQIIF